jgi:hypothetical protein
MLAAQTLEPKPRKTKNDFAIGDAPTLNGLAKEALSLHDNDVVAAREYLYEKLSNDPSLLRALIDHVVRTNAGVSVTSVIISQRSKAFNSVEGAARSKANAKAFAAVISSALLDMPLSNGTRLKDATQFEITETADRWEKQAVTMTHRARFLRLIASSIPPGKRCGDVLTEKQAAALYRKTAPK